MVILRRLYSIYCISIFIGLFGLLLIPFLVLIQRPNWRRPALWLNHFWAKAFFTCCLVPVKIEYRSPISSRGQYIFCPNHFSYIDIPTMGLTPLPFAFVGKNSMARIPVFGYMYRKLHILVDRNNIRSRYETLQRSVSALDAGLSLTIFPEGGIVSADPPQLANFKPGPFKAAIESGTPIVPVTLINNWQFLPDDDKFLPSHRTLKVVFHEPVDTTGYTSETINDLNRKVFNIIAAELDRNHSHEGFEGNIRKDRSPSPA